MSKKLKIIIAALLLLTAVVAVIHLGNQKDVKCLLINYAGEEIAVSFEDLNKQEFSGELIDGKGDVTSHVYTGVLLKDLLAEKGIELSTVSGLKITSADNYSVEFGKDEVLAEDRLYAATVADGKAIEGIDPGTEGVQIIIFGDENSRRCVRFASIITVY